MSPMPHSHQGRIQDFFGGGGEVTGTFFDNLSDGFSKKWGRGLTSIGV